MIYILYTIMTKSKKTKRRCALKGCKKKISFIDPPCICEKTYCSSHRLITSHSCPIDQRKRETDKLKVDLADAKFEKIIQI